MCKTTKKAKPVEVNQPVEVKETQITTPSVTPVAEPIKEEVVVKEEPKKAEPNPDDLRKQVVNEVNAIAEEMVFELGKAQLNGEALKKLDAIANFIKKNPGLDFNIIGYTCDKGSEDANNVLFIQRSTYVKNQLINRGVKSENIKESKGIGSKQPLYVNNSETRSKNRTVRFELSR
ncbi:MAG: OmpA family protein [Sphingobacteriaceae bacterium]|nr:OmpA family protein [Sphingobacteriaceae bacterium]